MDQSKQPNLILLTLQGPKESVKLVPPEKFLKKLKRLIKVFRTLEELFLLLDKENLTFHSEIRN